MSAAITADRRVTLHRRVRLIVAFTITYNILEGIIAVAAGAAASSAALIGFGLDSFIEVLSAVAVAWQFTRKNPERWEKPTVRAIGIAFFALAVYVTVDAIIALAGVEPVEHVGRHRLRIGIAHALDLREIDVIHEILAIIALHRVPALLADGDDLDRLALGEQVRRLGLGELGDVGVEATAQATFGGHHHQKMHLVLARPGQKPRRVLGVPHRGRELFHHRVEAFGVRPRHFRGLLSAAKLRRGDHLHGLRDLAGLFDRRDPVFQVLEIRHCLISPLSEVGGEFVQRSLDLVFGLTLDLGIFLGDEVQQILVLAAQGILRGPYVGDAHVIAGLIILIREIAVSGLREFLGELQVSVPVSKLAKWKTTFQLVSLGALILGQGLPGWNFMMAGVEHNVPHLVGLVTLWGAAILTVITGWDYLRVGLKYMD